MEDLLPIIILICGLVASAASKSSKKSRSEAAKRRIYADSPQNAVNRQRAEAMQAPAAHPYAAPAKPAAPAQPASMASMLPPQAPLMSAADVPAMAPAARVSIHPHLQPDCNVHDAPSGSLNVASPEGKDPCHAPQLKPRPAARYTEVESAEETSGLNLDWSGEGMVKAFIMQEVLTRPCQRRAAR